MAIQGLVFASAEASSSTSPACGAVQCRVLLPLDSFLVIERTHPKRDGTCVRERKTKGEERAVETRGTLPPPFAFCGYVWGREGRAPTRLSSTLLFDSRAIYALPLFGLYVK